VRNLTLKYLYNTKIIELIDIESLINYIIGDYLIGLI